MTKNHDAPPRSGLSGSGSPHFIQRCVRCSRTYDTKKHVTACSCSGLTVFEYQDESIEWPPSKKLRGLVRYWPRLPILNPSNIIDEESSSGPPTPLFRSTRLGERLGFKNLWLKDESVNHTRTFKDRDALITISRFQEIGVREFAMSSTGNTAAAFAHALGKALTPMNAHIFLPRGTIIDFDPGDTDATTINVVNGDYSFAITKAKEYATINGITLEGGFSNPCRIEAAKTIAYEVAESELNPDWYVQGVTNGAGVYGFCRGYSELVRLDITERSPRILCVQPDGCAPMVKAFRGGRETLAPEDVPAESSTFVSTLSCTNPAFSYPYVRDAVSESGGGFEDVTDGEIAKAFVLLLKLEGKLVDPAAAVGLAGIIKSSETGSMDRDAVIVLSLSGGIRGTGMAPAG